MNLMKLVCVIFTLFLSSRHKLSRKYPPPRHISHLTLLTGILAHISPLKKAFEKCKPVSLFSRFWGTSFLIAMWIQPTFSFTELVTCKLKAFMFWETVAFQKGILQNVIHRKRHSQENTCVGVCFLIKPCNFIKKETLV